MIKCYLVRLMGEKKMKIIDVVREIGFNRNIIILFYKEIVFCVDLEVIDKFCNFFECEVSDLFEKVD